MKHWRGCKTSHHHPGALEGESRLNWLQWGVAYTPSPCTWASPWSGAAGAAGPSFLKSIGSFPGCLWGLYKSHTRCLYQAGTTRLSWKRLPLIFFPPSDDTFSKPQSCFDLDNIKRPAVLWVFLFNLLAIMHTGSYASPGGHCSEVLLMAHALLYSSGPFFFLRPSYTGVLLVIEPWLPWVFAAGKMLEFEPSMYTETWPGVSLTLLTSSSRSSSAARPAHRDFAIWCYCFMTHVDQ